MSYLSPKLMLRMLEIFNHRQINVERDGYPEQSFEIHFDVKQDDAVLSIDAFSGTALIELYTDTNVVKCINTAYDAPFEATFVSSYDCLLYTYHMLSILSNNDPNNAMFVMTVLPTIFTVLLKIYEELPESTDSELSAACQTILTHTQNICFDQNAVVISRKKL